MQNPDVYNLPRVHEASAVQVANPASVTQSPAAVPDDSEQFDPEPIFIEAICHIDTQPLHRGRKWKMPGWQDILGTLVCICIIATGALGTVWAALTYPTVTVIVVPDEKFASLITEVGVPLRHLMPVTLTRSLSAATTGKGHQDAKEASGMLTFYNGGFAPQTIGVGTVFTGADGIKVVVDQAVTIPAANPPYFGQASVPAHAIAAGAAGNIKAGDINTVCCFPSFDVKNTTSFTGGADERDYQAVARTDISTLTSQLKQALSPDIQRLFPLLPGEVIQSADCVFKASPNHQVGEEAGTVTIEGMNICKGVAYNIGELLKKATDDLEARSNPGPHYERVGTVQLSIISLSPFVVRSKGTWVYILTRARQRELAAKIAGDTPEQARVYLLHTGIISQAIVPQNIPKDSSYIGFEVLTGL